MMADLLVLASVIAIPFGDPVEVETAPTERANYEAAFEFVETEAGYTLSALWASSAQADFQVSELATCRTIDIEAFAEGVFGTPVSCNGETYEFDLQGASIVVQSSATADAQVIQTLAPGPVMINGVPLLIE